MSKKSKKFNSFDGIVFSTDPEHEYQSFDEEEEDTPLARHQDIRVQLDKKQRGGKAVTLVTGFKGREEDLISLGKMLKTRCGVGGTVKDREILIQGDFRKKIVEILLKEGFKVKTIGG